MKFLFTCLVSVSIALARSDDEQYERELRQAPVFFQNGLAPRGQIPKGQAVPIPKFASFNGAPPQGFRVAPAPPPVDERESEEEEIERNSIAPSPSPSLLPQQVLHFRQPPQVIPFRPSPSPLPLAQPIASAQVLQPQQALLLKGRPGSEPQRRQQQFAKNQLGNQPLSEEDIEEKEEPDRLTELLPQSKFNCNGKKTGYYADDGLNCEVFHYCQDNSKHSWICPEGFSFHQVHLICMPPSSENICQQSTQFHFVNDFLYRAVNIEEAQSRPNVSLRYADRYYPENYYETSSGDEEGSENVRTFQQRQPQQPQQLPSQPQARPRPAQFQPPQRPLVQAPQHFARPQPVPGHQFFNTPEDVNVPLQSRRPPPTATGPPQRQFAQAPGNFEFENK